tara:strand:- start:96194 stop:96958 length:765 start_codon:yes stop_codon:yes gene_type:complete
VINRIDQVFKKKKKILSIYFTAGFPNLDDTSKIIENLQNSGVDIIEIGLPFSDPLADGPTIQESSTTALKNGMNTSLLFKQIKNIRSKISIPLIIMGYFNPILQYGVEKFCIDSKISGIDGLIIPDLPIDIYNSSYKNIFESQDLYNIFLITPQTSIDRILKIDEISKGFIYMVSDSSITGAKNIIDNSQKEYFLRIKKMNLKNPTIVGFGISNSKTFKLATDYSDGAIIGSAFISFIKEHGTKKISSFIKSIR